MAAISEPQESLGQKMFSAAKRGVMRILGVTPQVLENAEFARKQELNKVDLGAVKIEPIDPPKLQAQPAAPEDKPVQKTVTSETKAETGLTKVKLVVAGTRSLHDRALAYAKCLARQRGVKEITFGASGEGFVAIFCDEPLDCYLIVDPELGAPCHPIFGVTIRLQRAIPAGSIEKIAV